MQQARLTALSGPTEGAFAILTPGTRISVGRLSAENQLSVPDRFLAPQHFEIQFGTSGCTLRDISTPPKKHAYCLSAGCFLNDLRNSPCSTKICAANDLSAHSGVFLNGKQVRQAELKHGDAVTAGGSAFNFELGELSEVKPVAPAALPRLALTADQQTRGVAFLAQQNLPIYAIVDAARSPAVLTSLLTHGELYHSLYDGAEGEKLAEVAPYLVYLPAPSALLALLLREHWGDNRFSLLLAPTDFKNLRRHLRRFLMVEDEQRKKMYFRFYDPRVLRSFLPSCTPAECADFFGPITWFVLETEQAGLGQAFSYKDSHLLRTERIQF